MSTRARRELGQHFLADENILGVIGRLAELDAAELAARIDANAAAAFSLPVALPAQ